MRVDFVIAGAQKSGTTALRAAICDHPQICFHLQKELHFFDLDVHFHPGQPIDYGLYHRYFPAPKSGQRVGAKAPSYLFFHNVPKRLYDYNPKTKIIVLLRNPIDRAYSQYWMLRRSGVATETFMERLVIDRSAPRQTRPGIIERGLYSEQLQRYLSLFPSQQLLALRYDEFVSTPQQTLVSVCRFLKIDPDRLAPMNATQLMPVYRYLPMSDVEWNYLRVLYADEITRLEKMFGWDCSDWVSHRAAKLSHLV